MNILNFEKKHIQEATELALADYYHEKQYVNELPQIHNIPDLNTFAENGLGIAAFDNKKMIPYKTEIHCHSVMSGLKSSRSRSESNSFHDRYSLKSSVMVDIPLQQTSEESKDSLLNMVHV